MEVNKKDFERFSIKLENCMNNMVENVNVKFKKLDDKAVIPTYAHDGDVGADMTAISVEYDELNDLYVYHTGLAIETAKSLGMLLYPRSSNRKTDCYLPNSVGIVDSAIYRGEIIFCYKPRISTYERSNLIAIKAYMKALSQGKTFSEAELDFEQAKNNVYEMTKNLEFAPYKVGDRIGQMVLMKRLQIKPIETDELSDSDRGTNGFGSSGN